jgi:hypothetical protein
MTLANDDSRIVLNGNTAPIGPSAPSLMELRMIDLIPTVFATAITPPLAPHHERWMMTAASANETATTAADDILALTVLPPHAPNPAGKEAATTRTTGGGSVGRRIVHTNDPDGLLLVHVYTTAPRPNGGCEVKIKNFRIHAGNRAGQAVAHALLDNGGNADWLLGYLYLTRVEVRTYPSGTTEDAGMASTGGICRPRTPLPDTPKQRRPLSWGQMRRTRRITQTSGGRGGASGALVAGYAGE